MTDKEKMGRQRRKAVKRMLADIADDSELCYIVDIERGCYWSGETWTHLPEFAMGYDPESATALIAHRFWRRQPTPVIRRVTIADHLLITQANERAFSLDS